jgi:serine/threonine protein kinase
MTAGRKEEIGSPDVGGHRPPLQLKDIPPIDGHPAEAGIRSNVRRVMRQPERNLPRFIAGRDWPAMTVAGRYEILGPLGAGGEAHVFRARDLILETEVALRLVAAPVEDLSRPPLPVSPDPAWVRLLDRGLDPAHGAYAAFELLRGETLGALAARGPLPPDEVRFFAHRALDAVGALHAAGWIHGDLNADNFLLHRGRTWKLLELPFHRLSARATSPLFGSIYTLSPEQIDGHRADVRSDLFALGCLIYFAAAGVYPHGAGSEADIAVGRLRFPATPLRDLAPGLPARFAQAIMPLLARDPADRPENVPAACALLRSADEPRHPVP